MAKFAQIGLRASQFIWTLLITALIGNVIAEAFSGNPSSVNYAIFVAVFSWIVLLIGIVAAVMDSENIILIALDTLAVIFTFVAGVVLAAKLHVHSCGNSSYTTTNSLTNGSHDTSKRCRELQASTAFFWFLFASFVGSLVLGIMGGGGTMSMRRPGIGRKGPSMSQV
ncbi:putative Non-classical export protein 2 [Hyaloscypha finlandica]|nr:putative Non-classical export protein 2 [Hyaloscypha finlandica]